MPGMNWAMPCAPLGLTASWRNRLSFQMRRVRNSTGRSWRSAAASISEQIVTRVSSGLASGSAGLPACSVSASTGSEPAPVATARSSMETRTASRAVMSRLPYSSTTLPSRSVMRRSMRSSKGMVVGGDERRHPRCPHELGERFEHVARRRRVEVARRLVGEQEPWRIGDRAGDRHTLLLAAGKLRRPVGRAVLDPHVGQQLERPLLGDLPRQAADELRDDDVLQCAELAGEDDGTGRRSRSGVRRMAVRSASFNVPAARPPMITSPPSGRSSSPAIWRSVDLPAPDGAASATSSPG